MSGSEEILAKHEEIAKEVQDMITQAKRMCPLLAKQDQLSRDDPMAFLGNPVMDELLLDVMTTRDQLMEGR